MNDTRSSIVVLFAVALSLTVGCQTPGPGDVFKKEILAQPLTEPDPFHNSKAERAAQEGTADDLGIMFLSALEEWLYGRRTPSPSLVALVPLGTSVELAEARMRDHGFKCTRLDTGDGMGFLDCVALLHHPQQLEPETWFRKHRIWIRLTIEHGLVKGIDVFAGEQRFFDFTCKPG